MRHLILLATVVVLISPSTVSAQGFPPDLVVWLRDTSGAGVAGVTVVVRDHSGMRELRRTTTDANGRAELVGVEDPVVRVVVQGHASSVKLYQVGEDAQGIRLVFGTRPTQLDLRVESDGMVLPDPATMIAPDPSLADEGLEQANLAATIQAFPEAPAAPAVVLPVATEQPAVLVGADAPAMAEQNEESAAAESPAWLGWLLVALFASMCALGVFAYQRWGRA